MKFIKFCIGFLVGLSRCQLLLALFFVVIGYQRDLIMTALYQIIQRFKWLPELNINFIHFDNQFLSFFEEKSEKLAHCTLLFDLLSLTGFIDKFIVWYVVYLHVEHINQLLDKRLRVYFGE